MPTDLLTGVGPVVLAFTAGLFAGGAVPVYYFEERARGFGRAMVSRLPYEPPPGMDQEQALHAASTAADDHGEPDHPL